MTTNAVSKILEGLGVHTGEHTKVLIQNQEMGKTHQVRVFNDGHFKELKIDSFRSIQLEARYSTLLKSNEFQLYTPEHLWAALGIWKNPMCIDIYGSEVPLLDGSALPWLEVFEEANDLLEMAQGVEVSTYGTALEKKYTSRNGYLEVHPDTYFNVEYSIELGELRQSFKFSMEDSDWRQMLIEKIIPARTFATWKGYEASTKEGLLKGVDSESGWLIAETKEEYLAARGSLPELESAGYPYINSLSYRMEQEAAAHKILDLMGDLFLNGFSLPRLKIKALNTGHTQNHQLLKDLWNEQNK